MKLLNFAVSTLIAVSSSAVFADRDSSAIESQKLTRLVQDSTGVVMKVPINAAGEELQSGTELRVVNATDMSTSSENLPNLWNIGVDSSKTPQLDSSTDNGDSSTWWGWNRWNTNYGWSNNYYSNWYQPTYYYYGSNYNYGYYNYYNYYQPYYYNGYNYAGCRYYYYNRY